MLIPRADVVVLVSVQRMFCPPDCVVLRVFLRRYGNFLSLFLPPLRLALRSTEELIAVCRTQQLDRIYPSD